MTVKEKLTQFQTNWNQLKTKIKTKLTTLNQAVTDKNNQLNESNRKLELSMKEGVENEKVLDQLLKEFKELEESL